MEGVGIFFPQIMINPHSFREQIIWCSWTNVPTFTLVFLFPLTLQNGRCSSHIENLDDKFVRQPRLFPKLYVPDLPGYHPRQSLPPSFLHISEWFWVLVLLGYLEGQRNQDNVKRTHRWCFCRKCVLSHFHKIVNFSRNKIILKLVIGLRC